MSSSGKLPYNKMGESVVPFLHYDDVKASVLRSFSLHRLRSSVRRRHDRMQSARTLGPSSMHSSSVRSAARLLRLLGR